MNPELKTRLLALGLNDEQIGKLEASGAKEAADMKHLTADEIVGITGCGLITAKKIVAEHAPAPSPAGVGANGAAVPADAEIPEGSKPSPAQVNSFASQFGIPQDFLSMFLMSNLVGGAGGAMDVSGVIPIPTIVSGYNPKRRDMFLMVMGQIEAHLGTNIVVINQDGSINRELTQQYIEGLENGFDPAENDVYFDSAGVAYEVIAVGVDAQSIYDADPLRSEKPLQQNGMGIGRVAWKDVGLEAKQTAFYAVQTGEIDPNNPTHLDWLRDHIKPGVSRLAFQGRAPQAVAKFNANQRTGTLPTLRVMLNRSPRRPETMPRRRRLGVDDRRDLSGISGRHTLRGEGEL